jgi:hypothetical protein
MATTLNKIVYNILDLRYGGVTPDDTYLSERQIKHWVHTERAVLLQQELSKKRELPIQVVQDLGCVPLDCVSIVECCDSSLSLGSDEFIGRTPELPIPLASHYSIQGVNDLFTYVGLVDGTPIDLTSEVIALNGKYKKFTANKRRAFYKNNRIYVTNPEGLEIINIRGIFTNPEEAAKFNYCSGDPCYSDDSIYPLMSYLESPLIQIILSKYLNYSINPNLKDLNNDAKDNS